MANRFWQYMEGLDHNLWISVLAIIGGFCAILLGLLTLAKEKVGDRQTKAHFSLDSQTKRLAESIDTAVKRVSDLSENINDLSSLNNRLVKEGNKAIAKYGELTNSIKQISEEAIARQQLSGELGGIPNYIPDLFSFPSRNTIKVYYGQQAYGADAILTKTGEGSFSEGSTFYRPAPFSVNFIGNVPAIKLQVKDLDDAVILELENNLWTLLVDRYRINFDDRNLEILDRYDNVLFSFAAVDPGVFLLQGYQPQGDDIIVFGKHKNEVITNKNRPDIATKIRQAQQRCNVQRLFSYKGSSWIGKKAFQNLLLQFSEPLRIGDRHFDVLIQSSDLINIDVTLFHQGELWTKGKMRGDLIGGYQIRKYYSGMDDAIARGRESISNFIVNYARVHKINQSK